MFTAISIIYTDYAHGDRHVWDAPPDKRTTLVLCMWCGELSFLVCGGLTKCSILLFYRRLVNGTYSTRYKWLIWTAIAFTIAYTFAFCVMLLANCTPTRAYWMAFDIRYALTEDYTCLDTSIINTMAGVCAAISDVYSVVLPCILTWKLKSVPKAQKIALFGIFSLGLVIVGVSGVRTYWLIGTYTKERQPHRQDRHVLTVIHRNGHLKRHHTIRLQPVHMGANRTPGRHHVRFRASFARLLSPLPW
jgi:hypothetical protein